MSPTNENLGRCLVEVYVDAVELLGAGMPVIEGLSPGTRIRDELLDACTEAVLHARSFCSGDVDQLASKVDRARDRFRTAEALLRRLRTEVGADEPEVGAQVGAAIEIAQRGGAVARTGFRMLTAPPRSG